MFIINPDPYSMPCYRIGPFRTNDIALNHLLPYDNQIESYFKERFYNKSYIYTYNGREAIKLALSFYNLESNDVVTILTTSGNFYISSCVTKEIEKYCKWSREIRSETKLLFVNHEFGYPYNDLRSLKELGYPIIEDCAGAFFSKDKHNNIGNIGDFVIYSFPKMFPLQIGGLLVSNLPVKGLPENGLDTESLSYIKNVLSNKINTKEEIIKKRVYNYKYLEESFKALGFAARFPRTEDTVPGVFMFSTTGTNLDLPELKKYYYSHGVQCSVFYGEEAFFIPVHQALDEPDLEYFTEIMKSFIENRL